MVDRKEYKADWYQKNKERLKEKQEEYNQKNKEKIKAYRAEYYLKNNGKHQDMLNQLKYGNDG